MRDHDSLKEKKHLRNNSERRTRTEAATGNGFDVAERTKAHNKQPMNSAKYGADALTIGYLEGKPASGLCSSILF
jgi:hypothetical protein